MSSLIFNNMVVATGSISEDESQFLVNGDTSFPKSSMAGAVLIDQEPPSASKNGWMYVDGKFLELPSVEVEFDEDKANEVRYQRNAKLSASDWTQSLDAGSRCDQAAWAAYRQELCDITKQPGFPKKVVWPINPNGVI